MNNIKTLLLNLINNFKVCSNTLFKDNIGWWVLLFDAMEMEIFFITII